MHAQNAVGLGVGDKLHKTARVTECARPAVGTERKRSGAVRNSGGFEISLRLPDPCDLGRSVDDPGHRVEIDMAMLAGDPLCNCNAFVFGLVGEHRPAHNISDRPHAGKVGPAIAID